MKYSDIVINYFILWLIAGVIFAAYNKTTQLVAIGALIGLMHGTIRYLVLAKETKQTRYIPEQIKQAVLKRYFNMCAVCPDKQLLEFHHKIQYADGGLNDEENITPLCPKHHAMITRLENGGFEYADRK